MATVQYDRTSTTQLERRQDSVDVTPWFRPQSQTDVDRSNEVLKLAYEKAMLSHQEQNKGRRKSDLDSFFASASMNDVLAHIESTEKQYAASKDGKSHLSKALVSSWTSTVARINSFSSIIDVLVSTHPEYAAPVWGTIRFLITATLRHQELATKVADAFDSITNALPDLEFLANILYPIPKIQETLASMYSHIIDFCIRALKWYRKANGSIFRKTFAAIKDPWALEFEDVVRQIKQTTDRIYKRADIAHKAETRYINTKVSEVSSKIQQLQDWGNQQNLPVVVELARPNSAQSLQISTLPSSPEPLALPVIPFQPETVAKYLQPIEFDPEQTLNLGKALRDRRRARGASGYDRIWTSVQLRDWISQPGSALVQLEGSMITTDPSKDFALDMIELTHSAGLPLAWYVGISLPSSSGAKLSAADIFRLFISQMLGQNKSGFENSKLTEAKFSCCASESDWLGLLVEVASEMAHLVLILDAGDGDEMPAAVRRFWSVVDERKPATAIKMLLLTYPAPGCFMPALVASDAAASSFTVALGQDRRPGMARASMSGNARGPGRAVPRQGAAEGPSQLRPFMLRLKDPAGDERSG